MAFGALFFSKLFSVLGKDDVSAQDFTNYVENPIYTSFAFDLSTNFILGFGITGLNLSDTNRYFDISLSTEYSHYQ